MTTLISHYLQANLLICVGYFLLRVFQTAEQRLIIQVRYADLLKLSRLFLVSALVFPIVSHVFPSQSFLTPSAQVWNAPTMQKIEPQRDEAVISLGNARTTTISTENVQRSILVGLLVLAVFAFARFSEAAWKLRRAYLKTYRLRRIGRTEIRISDTLLIPFSYWLPSSAYIFIPSHLLTSRDDFFIAVHHEIQHHRQQDTLWSYGSELFRGIFFLNPFAHFWVNQLSKIQEFACDEALIQNKSVSPQAYGSCLLRVAETARGTHAVLVGTTCMAVSPSGAFLKRRIQHMLNVETKRYLGKSAGLWIGTFGITAMATATWAGQSIIQDRRVTMTEAKQLAESVQKRSNFPITINQAVVKELNRYVGTPDGREFVKNALARMENYRTLVEGKLDQYGLPHELMAMPIMESGYQNLPQSPHPMHSAGVWQIVPQTARNYGLIVDNKTDERLHIEKSTDAASRYLGRLHFQFQNWELAILAYNAGEHKVQKGINKTGSRNAWTLIDNGFGADERYLPKMVAAVLLLNNPAFIE